MNNITLEQRNAQKLNNLLNIANLNVKNKDIYFFLKCNVKVLLNKLQLSPKDLEILSGHVSAFSNELTSSKWDLRKFDPKKYQKFLDDLFNKIDFRKVDTEFMFKCKDLLEISPIKDELYKKRMEFFDKKLPKIGNNTVFPNNNITSNNKTTSNAFVKNTVKVNSNTNNNTNTNNINLIQPVNPFENTNDKINNITNVANNPNPFLPVNPFAGMNESSNPYANLNNGPSPYQQNFENNNQNNNTGKTILRSIPHTTLNNMNNNNNNIDPYKPKVIPDDIKTKIIKELQSISGDLVNGKIDNCRYHSIEALLYFKQIFPD